MLIVTPVQAVVTSVSTTSATPQELLCAPETASLTLIVVDVKMGGLLARIRVSEKFVCPPTSVLLHVRQISTV